MYSPKIYDELLKAVYENEPISKQMTEEEIDEDTRIKYQKTQSMIDSVESRIDKSNKALEELKNRISTNSDSTKKFLDDVIKDV